MSDTVVVAIVGGVISLLLVMANAVAKRIERATAEAVISPVLTDSSALDITRTIRSAGEMLHDETRALVRRVGHEANNRIDEVLHMLEINERHRKEDMEEWRRLMKPTMFTPQLDALDKYPDNR
jgi:uncharacterized membrane protein